MADTSTDGTRGSGVLRLTWNTTRPWLTALRWSLSGISHRDIPP